MISLFYSQLHKEEWLNFRVTVNDIKYICKLLCDR